MRRKLVVLAALLLVAAAAYLHYGAGEKKNSVTVVVGSKDFTESILLSEIFARALEDAGIKVERKQALGGTPIIQAAMESGEVSLYPEYTSTALIMVLKEAADFDPQSAYNKVKAAYKEKYNFILLDMAKLNNSQGMAIIETAADEYGVRTLTDLSAAAPHLRLCSTPEFEDRADGLAGLRECLGGFDFEWVRVFDKEIKYEVLRNGEADVNICFTTDAALSRGDIVAIEDDIAFWPPYNLAPIVRGDVLEKEPRITEVLNPIVAVLDNPTMQKLNADVDIEQKEYREVAAAFLKEKGFIK